MQPKVKTLAQFALAVFGLVNQAFVLFGYVAPVPLDKVLHLSEVQLTVLFSFLVATMPQVHKLAADVLSMVGGILNRDAVEANQRYAALQNDVGILREQISKLQSPLPPSQTGRSFVGYLLGVAMLIGIGLAAIASLPGCTTAGPTTQQTLLVSCTAYADTLQALTPMRAAHRLSADQVAAVDQAVAIAGPICSGPLPADPAAALLSLSNAVTGMQQAVAAPTAAASK